MPLKVYQVERFVKPSRLSVPVSRPASSTRLGLSATASIITSIEAAAPSLPAASTTFAEKLCKPGLSGVAAEVVNEKVDFARSAPLMVPSRMV